MSEAVAFAPASVLRLQWVWCGYSEQRRDVSTASWTYQRDNSVWRRLEVKSIKSSVS